VTVLLSSREGHGVGRFGDARGPRPHLVGVIDGCPQVQEERDNVDVAVACGIKQAGALVLWPAAHQGGEVGVGRVQHG
jgi:hypothetical protein